MLKFRKCIIYSSVPDNFQQQGDRVLHVKDLEKEKKPPIGRFLAIIMYGIHKSRPTTP